MRQNGRLEAIKVIKLLAQETGTYNPVYLRPYETFIDGKTCDIINDKLKCINNAGNFTPYLFTGVAGGILTPSASAQSQINIPEGWNERRIRFILELEVNENIGSTYVDYIQGYTNYLGISANGNIDPNMQFIINSYIRVKRALIKTQYGTEIRDIIMNSSNILSGEIYGASGQDVYSMRPQDVFSGIQSGYLGEQFQNKNELIDTRILFTGQNIGSNRANNISSNYLAKTLENFVHSKNLQEFGQKELQIMDSARHMAGEGEIDLIGNTFLRKIASLRDYGTPTSFTMKELVNIDPNTPNNTHFISLGSTAKLQLHQAGQTSFWNGSDRETQIATILSNAVPALMMECLFSKVGFKSTNSDMSGKPNTVFYDGKSLTNMDLTQSYVVFKKRLETEVLFDITYGNQDTYFLDMYADMFGETMISLSVAGGPSITYTTPSFCDSLMSPVVTMDHNSFYKVTNDFETLFNNITNNNNVVSYNKLV